MGKKKRGFTQPLEGLFDDLLAEAPSLDDLLEEGIIEREMPNKEVQNISLVMFWERITCSCGAEYEAPHYHTDMLLEQIHLKQVKYFGKHHHYTFSHVRYIPVPDVSCYDKLPRRTEIIERTLRKCRKCAHRPNVIYLEAAS